MKLRLIILLIPFVVALASPLWWSMAADFLRPPRDLEENHLPPPPGQLQQFAMEGIFFTQSTGARQDWQITASRLGTAAERETLLHLEEVDALLHGEGESKLQVSSNAGTYDTDGLVLTLQEDVQLRLGNDYELRTDMLRYLERTGKLETEAPVRLEGPELEIQGQGMVYDLATGAYSVGGRVNVLLKNGEM